MERSRKYHHSNCWPEKLIEVAGFEVGFDTFGLFLTIAKLFIICELFAKRGLSL